MQKLSVSQINTVIGTGKFFTIQGYKKADGTTSTINARQGVQKRTKGGSWNGNPQKHVLVAKPARGAQVNSESDFNGFRTLIKASMVGAIIKANGEVYEVVE